MGRREALKWVATALATLPVMEWKSLGAEELKRTLTDPDLFHPGKLWDRTLMKAELRTVAALCDVIIPADEKSRSASQMDVPDFIDEWVSAPYPLQQENKTQIKDGLAWLDAEGKKRFEKEFADLTDEQKQRICDDICFVPKARPEFEKAARFFALFRDLTATGFYTTKEGMKDLQYIGNTPQIGFKGPPKEVLEYLKLV
jgi:hypothetical protein